MNLGQIGRKVAALLTRRRASSAVESQMRHDWDQRARENALYYIATDSADSEETFTASGEQSVQAILEDIDALLPSKGVVLEIGCGVGRMLRPLACRFGAVYGLDVSPEMISRARARLADLRNVQVWANGGIDLRPVRSEQVDLAISYLVFQHIPEASVVEAIIQDTFRVLKPGGVFKFQVAGRPDTEEAAAGEGSRGKDTWVGVSFSDPEIRTVVENAGFNVLSTYSHKPPDSCIFLWVIAQKQPDRGSRSTRAAKTPVWA